MAAAARKDALQAMKTGAPWSRTAAEVALAESDTDLLGYARTGWLQAAQQDDRVTVEDLALNGGSGKIRTAAARLCPATPRRSPRSWPRPVPGRRAGPARLPRPGGLRRRTRGQGEGRRALASGSLDQYREFATTGQDTARTQDERVTAAQLVDSGGRSRPPPHRLGRPAAAPCLHPDRPVQGQRQDQLAATHTRIQQLIAQTAATAATAQKPPSRPDRRHARKAHRGRTPPAQTAAGDAQELCRPGRRLRQGRPRPPRPGRQTPPRRRSAQARADNAALSAIDSATDAQSSELGQRLRRRSLDRRPAGTHLGHTAARTRQQPAPPPTRPTPPP
ncbi:hypothetical protein GXW82_42900 [Streptacidiphilus sp. 4-A2]|nr:hypothetical protein [Streptacidiphilus sp. 4-A2]